MEKQNVYKSTPLPTPVSFEPVEDDEMRQHVTSIAPPLNSSNSGGRVVLKRVAPPQGSRSTVSADSSSAGFGYSNSSAERDGWRGGEGSSGHQHEGTDTASRAPRLPNFIQVFSATMDTVMTVPSELLLPSRGLSKYLTQWRRHGEYHIKRFVMCPHVQLRQPCPLGEECGDLHVADPAQLRGCEVCDVHYSFHVSPSLDAVPHTLLPAGRLLSILERRSNKATTFDTGLIYATEGSRDMYDHCAKTETAGDGGVPFRRMQHCTHYLKHCCARGSKCHFIHVAFVAGVVYPVSIVQEQAVLVSKDPDYGPVIAPSPLAGGVPVPPGTIVHQPSLGAVGTRVETTPTTNSLFWAPTPISPTAASQQQHHQQQQQPQPAQWSQQQPVILIMPQSAPNVTLPQPTQQSQLQPSQQQVFGFGQNFPRSLSNNALFVPMQQSAFPFATPQQPQHPTTYGASPDQQGAFFASPPPQQQQQQQQQGGGYGVNPGAPQFVVLPSASGGFDGSAGSTYIILNSLPPGTTFQQPQRTN